MTAVFLYIEFVEKFCTIKENKKKDQKKQKNESQKQIGLKTKSVSCGSN
jgi:hypothetical protein